MELIKKIFLLMFIINSFSRLSAQSEKANQEFISGNYSNAAMIYKEYLSKEENMNDGPSWLNLAVSLFQLENYGRLYKPGFLT